MHNDAPFDRTSRSKRATMIDVVVVIVSVVLTVVAQLLVKYGIDSLSVPAFADGLASGFMRVFTSGWVIFGIGLYFISALAWVYALSRVDLGYAYPFVSLSYVMIILSARFVLGETVPPVRWIGISLICVGVLLVAQTR